MRMSRRKQKVERIEWMIMKGDKGSRLLSAGTTKVDRDYHARINQYHILSKCKNQEEESRNTINNINYFDVMKKNSIGDEKDRCKRNKLQSTRVDSLQVIKKGP